VGCQVLLYGCSQGGIQSAEQWLLSAVDLSDTSHLTADLITEAIVQLQRTGVPAFRHEGLADLCDALLEALHSNHAFHGCLTQGKMSCL
jgi:hypothetical protein